jgi:hypothetical protein
MEVVPNQQFRLGLLLATDRMKLKCAVEVSKWFHFTLRSKSANWLKLRKVDANGRPSPHNTFWPIIYDNGLKEVKTKLIDLYKFQGALQFSCV